MEAVPVWRRALPVTGSSPPRPLFRTLKWPSRVVNKISMSKIDRKHAQYYVKHYPLTTSDKKYGVGYRNPSFSGHFQPFLDQQISPEVRQTKKISPIFLMDLGRVLESGNKMRFDPNKKVFFCPTFIAFGN